MSLRFMVVLVVPLLFASCHPRIPEADIHGMDLREIRVLMILEEGVASSEAERLISETNKSLIRQAGFYLVPVESWKMEFPSRNRKDLLQTIYLSTWDSRHQFDICISFIRKTPVDRLKKILLGDWMGIIDDTYRRYIVIKEMDKRVLAHEVYHAFIFSRVHSGCGIMSTLFELVPGIPLNYSMKLCKEDRKEVFANRNRSFDIPPAAFGLLGSDTVVSTKEELVSGPSSLSR
jgi:hypothetical protein